MEHSTVHALLADLAESAAPPSDVDISGATRDGRRWIRVRRLLTGAAAALATGAVLVVAALVLSFGSPVAEPRPIEPSPEPSRQASSSFATPTYTGPHFDPMTQYADFGWLPDGSTGTGVDVGRDIFATTAHYGPSGYVTLIVATGGFHPTKIWDYALAVDLAQGDEPAEPVNGLRARWLANPTQPVTLRWQQQPDVLAAVVVHMVGVDAHDVAHRVAETARFGVARPVALPLRVDGLPAGLPVARVSADRPGAWSSPLWSATVAYGPGPGFPDEWPLSIDVMQSTPDLDHSTVNPTATGEHPNTTVGGYPAHTDVTPDGGTMLTVYNVSGAYVRITCRDPRTLAALDGGLEGLFLSTQFFPDPADWQ